MTAVGGTNSYPEVAVYFSGGGFSNYVSFLSFGSSLIDVAVQFPRPAYQSQAVDQFLGKLGNTYQGLYNRYVHPVLIFA